MPGPAPIRKTPESRRTFGGDLAVPATQDVPASSGPGEDAACSRGLSGSAGQIARLNKLSESRTSSLSTGGPARGVLSRCTSDVKIRPPTEAFHVSEHSLFRKGPRHR